MTPRERDLIHRSPIEKHRSRFRLPPFLLRKCKERCLLRVALPDAQLGSSRDPFGERSHQPATVAVLCKRCFRQCRLVVFALSNERPHGRVRWPFSFDLFCYTFLPSTTASRLRTCRPDSAAWSFLGCLQNGGSRQGVRRPFSYISPQEWSRILCIAFFII